MLQKRHLDLLITHLRELKSEGVTHVNYSDEALDLLQQSLTSTTTMAAPTYPDLATPPTVVLPPYPDKQFLFEVLRAQVQANSTISNHLHTGCQFVLGRGNLNAPICVIGEAPGAEEEKAGKPFVGAAGKLLTQLMNEVGLNEENVFITNIMLWRPEMDTLTGNRPPTDQEMKYCLPYCTAQLDIVKPVCIVALGATAIAGLLGPSKTRRITQIRGQWAEYNGIPVMQTLHPSYILRTGTKDIKRDFIQDLISAKTKVRLPVAAHENSLYA
jgi:uracil-DNA glycosylase